MITALKTAKRCRVCGESVEELGTCGDCQREDVCVECWMTNQCCHVGNGENNVAA